MEHVFVRRHAHSRAGLWPNSYYNTRYGLTREEQDAFSARSHQKAAAAIKNGIFAEEIAPVSIHMTSRNVGIRMQML